MERPSSRESAKLLYPEPEEKIYFDYPPRAEPHDPKRAKKALEKPVGEGE